MRVARSIWGGAICVLTLLLISGLVGCEALLPVSEPPATWIPLPTSGPSLTPTPKTGPGATPTLDARPSATATPLPLPTATATLASEERVDERAAAALWARDLSWLTLVERAAHPEAPPDPEWEAVAPKVGVDETLYGFVAASWTLHVTVPLTVSEGTGYDVVVSGPDDFEWAAGVQPSGEVLVIALEPTPAPQVVADWRGVITALPAEAGFDDYVRIVSATGGQYGLCGASEEIEARIAAWRDGQTVVRIWGQLLPQAADYGDSRIVVERIEAFVSPTVVPESELVEGWQGIIRLLPADAGYDDFFDGLNPPGQYGVPSAASRIGGRAARRRRRRAARAGLGRSRSWRRRLWPTPDRRHADRGDGIGSRPSNLCSIAKTSPR